MMTESDPVNTITRALTDFFDEQQKRDQRFISEIEAKMSESLNRWIRTTVKLTIAETTTNILNSIREIGLCSSCQSKLATLEKQLLAKQGT
jgi:hypothetical protein